MMKLEKAYYLFSTENVYGEYCDMDFEVFMHHNVELVRNPNEFLKIYKYDPYVHDSEILLNENEGWARYIGITKDEYKAIKKALKTDHLKYEGNRAGFEAELSVYLGNNKIKLSEGNIWEFAWNYLQGMKNPIDFSFDVMYKDYRADNTEQYIICWMTRGDEPDKYHVADGLEEAKTFYNGLLDNSPSDELYSASLCAVIESTDYTTHPLLKNL